MYISFIRTVVLYIILIATVRLMGKRQIGEMEPAEFVVTMLLANLAAVPMQDNAIPLFSGLIPILTVLGLELILAVLSIRSIPIRSLLCGKPAILIANGKIDQKALQTSRVSLDELTQKLRELEVFDLSVVQYAILETDGQLSVMLYPEYKPANAKAAGIKVKEANLPYTIISDGKLLSANLTLSGFDSGWLNRELKRLGCGQEELLLLTVDASGKTYAVRKESV